MTRLLLIAACGLALTACDRRPCLHSHQEQSFIYMATDSNGGFTLIPTTVDVCDTFGPEPKD